jgi:ATP-dependent exoDNAse (exonuclease V) beta subunit
VILPDLQRGARRDDRPLLYWTSIATGPGERGIVLAGRADSEDAADGGDALERWMRELGKERARLELGRLAYVAATRARRQLHLIGGARSRLKDEALVVKAPPAASLLGFLWPVLSPHFESALAGRAVEPAGRDDGRRKRSAPPARRLAPDYRMPEPPAPILAPILQIAGNEDASIRPEFDWAGAIAQAVGQVVHGELQRIGEGTAASSDGDAADSRWRRALAELGIDDAHTPAAIERIRRAMATVAGSARAARLLDPEAADARSELALTAMIDGVAHSLRIDRSFVDEAGVRWVVDWKTSAHEGGDRDAFLDRELGRYRGQLERYVRVLRMLEPDRPVRAGLYFPLLDAWREL